MGKDRSKGGKLCILIKGKDKGGDKTVGRRGECQNGEWATESRIGRKIWHGKAWKMADYHALNGTAGGEKIEGSNAKKLGLWKWIAKKEQKKYE